MTTFREYTCPRCGAGERQHGFCHEITITSAYHPTQQTYDILPAHISIMLDEDMQAATIMRLAAKWEDFLRRESGNPFWENPGCYMKLFSTFDRNDRVDGVTCRRCDYQWYPEVQL